MLILRNLNNHKKKIVFYLSTDSTRKQNYVKNISKVYLKTYVSFTLI